jgi:DNA polymerase-3 subunit epsilon
LIERLVGPAGRIVVFDCETTGVYAKDRVVEVALITVGSNGEVLDRWESLVNPGRDVGPTWIHGITGAAVADAPSFADLAGAIALRLDGAVLAAHNLPFDVRMIGGEFSRTGVDFNPGLGVDTLRLTGGKLGDVCRQSGSEIGAAHRALDDALATAQLLVRVAARASGPVEPARFRTIPPVTERTVVRDPVRGSIVITVEHVPAVLRAAARLPLPAAEDPGALSYLELLERVLEDLRIDTDESTELEALSRAAGLDGGRRLRLHHRYLERLIDEVLADGEVTAAEYEQLVRIAAALGIDQDVVHRRTRAGRSAATQFALESGMRLCITGDGEGTSREDLSDRLRREGFIVEDSVTKRTDLLIASDPSSQSGKAEKARRYGIPIVATGAMSRSRVGDRVEVTVLNVERLVAHVCIRCGATWTSPSRSARKSDICEDCRSTSRPASVAENPQVTRELSDAGASEVLVCESCGVSWQRAVTRGRKPKLCLACRDA